MSTIDIPGFTRPSGRLRSKPPVGPFGEARPRSPPSFTKLTGSHLLKFGTDVRHNRDFLLQTQDNGGSRGRFQFRAPQTASPNDPASQGGFANSFASFLLDVPAGVGRDLKVLDTGTRHWEDFSFIQDKWSVSPRLTVDIGLRHEYYSPLIGLDDRGGLSNYDPATNTLRVAGYGDVGCGRRSPAPLPELRAPGRRIVSPRRSVGASRSATASAPYRFPTTPTRSTSR